ncbi:hypothetical protein [Helicobacter sp. WB40]|uniref:hypothetical protein n=1 Tax=Helicobacter sp. WB40 TaxID=3004130 RepID=UPI0022EBE240|nr:hypothetical protein [Helicobacter sp. WB40]MDA3967433.1 hypothetical protein [Helicobacter sp. WB40]
MIRECKNENIGIFGVNGVGALMACRYKKINFIVDEDVARQKMLFDGRAIISPKDAQGDILLAFRNKSETNRIYKILCEKYPNKRFINLCKDFI